MPQAGNMDNKSCMVSLKDVEQPFITKTNEKLYLRNINLAIATGEIFGIIGRSGAGKSALLKCINLLERPITGMVCIDKMNYTVLVNNELRDARRNIGMVPQPVHLINTKTVYENIVLPLEFQNYPKDDMGTLAQQMLQLVGLEDKTNIYPRQLTPLQQQLVAIARAMITKPKVLLCDEITSGLDHKGCQIILKVLKEINDQFNTTIVAITNDLEVLKTICDRVGVMHQGELVEQTAIFDFFLQPQSEVGKDFIRAATKQELPLIFRRQLKLQQFANSHPLLRITYTEDLTPESLLTSAVERFQVSVAILQAHQEQIQAKHIKILIIELEGTPENTKFTNQFLLEYGLHVEVLGYVNNNI